MKLLQSLSGKVVLLIFTVFVVSFVPKLGSIASGEDTCVCAYDGYGYYVYLPHFFNEGNLNITQEKAQQLQNEYCGGIYAYQIVRTENGKELNAYQMGQALIELPAYLIGDISARIFGFKTDGFSKPYYVLFILNGLFFIFLGLIYLRKLVLLYLNEKTTALTILFLYFATNIYTTFYLQNDLQHLFLFGLNSIFLYHTIQFSRKQTKKHLLYSAIILGLTVAIRPTQVLMGIVPTILLLKEFGISLAFFKRIWIYPAFGLLWNLPQIAYWWIVGGEPFMPNLHSEDIVLSDPNLIDFLFSYKKGWLLYSPVFLIAIHGFYVLHKRSTGMFWAILLFLPMYIWVMSSWECWWYAQSFGSRVMVDIYPVLAILIGLSISDWKRGFTKIAGFGFLIVCSLLAMLQTHQGMKGYLSYENMTKQHYWYIFGRTNIEPYSGKHLEMNRGAIDSTWISNAQRLPKPKYRYSETLIYSLEKPVTIPSGSLFLTDIVVLDKLPSDEGMLRIEIESSTSDSTKSALLMTETFSIHNFYNWSPTEISIGQRQNQSKKETYYINLQRMRHREDKMHFYFVASEGVTIDVKSLRILGCTLKRK